MKKVTTINNKGIGLLEVIAALGVATVVITSLVSLSVFTLRSSLKSKLLLEGSKVANREMELVRAARDKDDWRTFLLGTTGAGAIRGIISCTSPTNAIVCNMNWSTGAINTGSAVTPLGVSRGFFIRTAPTNPVQVTVVTYWKDGTSTKNNTLRTELSNWRDTIDISN